jgi:AraC-like DNA-binding protein
MRIDHRLPDIPLRPFIDRYWSWQSTGTPPTLLPLMPGPGGMEIFFHFHTPFVRSDGAANARPVRLPLAHIACVRNEPMRFTVTAPLEFVAVRVRAGAIPWLTGMPATELLDCAASAEDIWGNAAAELAERLALARDAAKWTALLDAFFRARLRPPPRGIGIEGAIALLQKDQSRIADVASAAGLGRRHLEYRFRAATGSTPVRFRRLARLQRAMRTLALAPPDRTLTFLLDPGYVDQAHQTHEFRALTGFSPTQVRRALLDGHAHFYNASWPR